MAVRITTGRITIAALLAVTMGVVLVRVEQPLPAPMAQVSGSSQCGQYNEQTIEIPITAEPSVDNAVLIPAGAFLETAGGQFCNHSCDAHCAYASYDETKLAECRASCFDTICYTQDSYSACSVQHLYVGDKDYAYVYDYPDDDNALTCTGKVSGYSSQCPSSGSSTSNGGNSSNQTTSTSASTSTNTSTSTSTSTSHNSTSTSTSPSTSSTSTSTSASYSASYSNSASYSATSTSHSSSYSSASWSTSYSRSSSYSTSSYSSDSSSSSEPFCGNGVVEAGEECDDGMSNVPLDIANMSYPIGDEEALGILAQSGCLETCKFSKCANGVDEVDEVVDDSKNPKADLADPACHPGDCADPTVGINWAVDLLGHNSEDNPCLVQGVPPEFNLPGEGQTSSQYAYVPEQQNLRAQVANDEGCTLGGRAHTGQGCVGANCCAEDEYCRSTPNSQPGKGKCKKLSPDVTGFCSYTTDCATAYDESGNYSPHNGGVDHYCRNEGNISFCCSGGNCSGNPQKPLPKPPVPGPIEICGGGGGVGNPPPPGCGNGKPDAGEACDDGNQVNNDGCTNMCQLPNGPFCGDGKVNQQGEECDDGNQNDADACSNNCLLGVVGQCNADMCKNNGAPVCNSNEVCQVIGQLPCIQCVPKVGICLGDECVRGGTAACAAEGKECSLTNGLPCITCIAPNSCGNGQIDFVEQSTVDPGCSIQGSAGQFCVPDGMIPDDFGVFGPEATCYRGQHCAMTAGVCAWEETPELTQCLAEKSAVAAAAPKGAANNGGCARMGCFGELCVDVKAPVLRPHDCAFTPDVACYDSAECTRINGTCAWRQTDELLKCLADNATVACPSGQSCLSRSACTGAGGSMGSTCGGSLTNVCCTVVDQQMEECDDGNRIDDDKCSNQCVVNCHVNSDCLEGACVEGQCRNQCVVEQAVHPAPLAQDEPPDGFLLRSLKEMLDAVGRFSYVQVAHAESPAQCPVESCTTDADCTGDVTCVKSPADATQDACWLQGNVCVKQCLFPRCINNQCAMVAPGGIPTSPYTPCDNAVCPAPRCGDGVWQPLGVDAAVDTVDDEQCDDHNNISNDGCSASCKREVCGDGVVQALGTDGRPNTTDDEECDDGNTDLADGCSERCKIEVCGNGRVDWGELCDNGTGNSDTVPGACRTNCMTPTCNDGVIDGMGPWGEQCDCGPEGVALALIDPNVDPQGRFCTTQNAEGITVLCDAQTCDASYCGDGSVNNAGMDKQSGTADDEMCDDGVLNSDDPFEPNVCEDHSECLVGICLDGKCSEKQCSSNVDCNGAVCVGGSCKSGGCVIDSDCGEDRSCVAGSCLSQAGRCYVNTDCSSGKCSSGTCAEPPKPKGSYCRMNCKPARCGDGIVDEEAGETCDEGTAMFKCLIGEKPACDCAIPSYGNSNSVPPGLDFNRTCCADNILCDVEATETCPGNCGVGSVCGNGRVEAGEECDMGGESKLFVYRPNRDGTELSFVKDDGRWTVVPSSIEAKYAAIDHAPITDNPALGNPYFGGIRPVPDHAFIRSSATEVSTTYFHLWDVNTAGTTLFIQVNAGIDFTGKTETGEVLSTSLESAELSQRINLASLNTAILVVKGDPKHHTVSFQLFDPVSGTAITRAGSIIAPVNFDGSAAIDIDALELIAYSNDANTSVCQQCTLARCGNGIKEGSEQCDDQNTESGDGCTDRCALEICALPDA